MKIIQNFIKSNIWNTLLLLGITLIVSMVSAISIGTASIEFSSVWRIIANKTLNIGNIEDISLSTENIIWFLRLPRIILVAMVGMFLTLSGVGMQAFTKNPLADPYVLGVSSGASFGAVLAIVFRLFSFMGSLNIAIGAFVGALFSITVVYLLSKNRRDISPVKLVLIGVAVSAMFGAFTNYAVYMAPNDAKIREATFWMLGGFAGVQWCHLIPATILIIPAIITMFSLSNSMNAMMMGDETAKSLGVNVPIVRKLLIIIIALMTSISVSVGGVIGFVGLVIPHITRAMVGTEHKKMLPISIFLGPIFLVWVDVGARTFDAPNEIPIGIITAMIGAPLFLWLIQYKKYSFGKK